MHYHELQQSKVELWAQVLDWVPPNMHNVEEFYKLLQPMLLSCTFRFPVTGPKGSNFHFPIPVSGILVNSDGK